MNLECNGVGRDAEHLRSLCFYFNRVPTDDEMRYLHDVMRRATACNPHQDEHTDADVVPFRRPQP